MCGSDYNVIKIMLQKIVNSNFIQEPLDFKSLSDQRTQTIKGTKKSKRKLITIK